MSRLPVAIMIGAVALTVSPGDMRAAEPAEIRLWPGQPPGPAVELGEEHDMTGPKDGLVAGKPVIRIGNVSTPTLTVFKPAAPATDTAVIVAPGGGHRIVAWDLEGTEVAEWLNGLGVTAFVLKYRVPVRNKDKPWESAVQDAHRAVRLVRGRAGEFGVAADKIGLLGFSAGGQTTAMACVLHAEETYPRVDDVDAISARPDFAAVVYPGGLLNRDATGLADYVVVNETLPPMFFAQPFPDFGRIENSLFFAAALKKAGVPAEVHVHATGGHGYGLRRTAEPCTHWPDACETWMRRMGWLPKAE
jgi:acetyl esterase/lipase